MPDALRMKPLILITNDDGIYSPGLCAAAEAVADHGALLIAAPRQQQTGMSRALTITPESGIIEIVSLEIMGKPHIAYAVHATPALTVAHAALEIAPHLPDLCISGINYGDNIGAILTASGTVGAALEASSCGIPAVAVSREAKLHHQRSSEYASMDWGAAAYFTRRIAEQVLKQGMPPGVAVLNVNVPDSATPETEIHMTIQSRQPYYYFKKNTNTERDFSRPHTLNIEFAVDRATLESNSDIQAFVYDRVVSITPLSATLTASVNLNTWYKAFSA